MSDIRVSFVGKDSKGKEKRVDFHVYDLEKAQKAIGGDEKLAQLSGDIEQIAAVGADLIENYADAHKIEVSKDGYADGSESYPFAAAAKK